MVEARLPFVLPPGRQAVQLKELASRTERMLDEKELALQATAAFVTLLKE
jgi:hypothetical protein